MIDFDTNYILRHAIEDDDPNRRKLLWHLHSYLCEDGGDSRFDREIIQWFADEYDALQEQFGLSPLDAALRVALGLADEFPPITHSRMVLKLLEKHMEQAAKLARENFYQTNIGKTVWETLDWCLEERRPCFIEGWEGRGKTANAKAWYAAHRGEARYASLDGLTTQRDFFSALARAYGIPFSGAKAPNEIRFRLRDVIVRSGLLLIIDEAHFCLPERTQRGRPALLDWIDSALCNDGVPVALVTTPQFGPRLAEFENRDREMYNLNQFKRRFSRKWCQLPKTTASDDLLALAKRALPNVGEKGFRLAAEYAGAFGRDVSGLFDLVEDAQRRARKAGRTVAIFQDLRDAYKLDRIPTENAMAASFSGTSRQSTDPKVQETNENGVSEIPANRIADVSISDGILSRRSTGQKRAITPASLPEKALLKSA